MGLDLPHVLMLQTEEHSEVWELEVIELLSDPRPRVCSFDEVAGEEA